MCLARWLSGRDHLHEIHPWDPAEQESSNFHRLTSDLHTSGFQHVTPNKFPNKNKGSQRGSRGATQGAMGRFQVCLAFISLPIKDLKLLIFPFHIENTRNLTRMYRGSGCWAYIHVTLMQTAEWICGKYSISRGTQFPHLWSPER